jgi:hypothetical protein
VKLLDGGRRGKGRSILKWGRKQSAQSENWLFSEEMKSFKKLNIMLKGISEFLVWTRRSILHSSPNGPITRVIQLRAMRFVGHVVRMEEMRNGFKF